ncbi:MAG TPA: outer membrane beta-barrel protein [Flavobacteriales bacterium]|jgi:hypothetical protein|nr:porin [Flavobacteriales bacterium]MBK6548995.1 porin [Flavobacteriales bacterium]MBK7100809.1 porin [Flavobacteriales bacterium]MBK7111496.1 porin [Flavobacteriales bacterium]MBK8532855.1 porin [Flavobacteriales bacterium]
MSTAKAGISIDPHLSGMTDRCFPGRTILLAVCVVGVTVAGAQDSSRVHFSAYVEAYYAFDLSLPKSNIRPYFLYNHKVHNTASINLALIQASVERQRVRGVLGLMAGNYAQYNLGLEPLLVRNLFETYVGLRLSAKHDLWLDAGILPSHIGVEGAIGLDQITLTRSLVAENSPYYEAGARVQYKPNDRWLLSALLLNGWQRIQRSYGNTTPSFGTQVQYRPRSGTTLNWSTYIGSVGPDAAGQLRIYNDLYAQVETERTVTALAVDVGMQKSAKPMRVWNGWLAMVAMGKGRISERWWAVGRIEYFLDDRAVMTDGLTTLGASLGVDLRIDPKAMWRIEGRFLGGANDPYEDVNGHPSATNTAITTSICVRF